MEIEGMFNESPPRPEGFAKKILKFFWEAAMLTILGVTPLTAQQNIRSPEVHADGRVTFRLVAPRAEEVLLEGAVVKEPRSLTRGDEGVWDLTVGPLEPDIYHYAFRVDGTYMIDPRNRNVKKWRTLHSLVEVLGDPPSVFELQQVPHGSVHEHWYFSRSLGRTRGLFVYTPAQYEQQPTRTFPVLFLLHGSGDDESTWTEVGRAHLIADNLAAQGKSRPLLIVMPYGHAFFNDGSYSSTAARVKSNQALEKDLFEEIIPLIESRYRIERQAQGRAIAGLSMGGGQALSIGLNHLDEFGWIAGFSSLVPGPLLEDQFPGLQMNPEGVNQKLKLLWIGCGKDDFLFQRNQDFIQWLKAKKIDHIYESSEGGHNWLLWRKYLAELLTLLFRNDLR